MRCPKCGTYNSPEEQRTYCKKCGTELRVVCPRCSADNPGDAEHCNECGLELHPDRGHERAAGIRVDPNTAIIGGVLKQRPTFSTGMLAVAVGVLIVVWIPVFLSLKKRQQFVGCQSHLRQLAVAMQAYAHDTGGNAPSAYDWSTSLMPYMRDRNVLQCPSRPDKVGYGFNLNLNEVTLSRLNNAGTLIAFFEARGEKTISGTQTLWLTTPAHSKGNNLVFVDGTVRQSLNTPSDNFWSAASATAPPTPTPAPAQDKSSNTSNAPSGHSPATSQNSADTQGTASTSANSPTSDSNPPAPGENPPPPGSNPPPPTP